MIKKIFMLFIILIAGKIGASAAASQPLTIESAQQHITQKVTHLYPHSSALAQAERIAHYMSKYKITEISDLARAFDRATKRIDKDFEAQKTRFTDHLATTYPHTTPAHQEALAHFLVMHALDITKFEAIPPLLHAAHLDYTENLRHREEAAQLRDKAHSETEALRAQLAERHAAQEAAEAAARAAHDALTREKGAHEEAQRNVARTTAALQAARAHNQTGTTESKEEAAQAEEMITAHLATEKKAREEAETARAAAEAAREEYHQQNEHYKEAIRELTGIATTTMDKHQKELKELTDRLDASEATAKERLEHAAPPLLLKPLQTSWKIAPLNEWKLPGHESWFPWVFIFAFYGSKFVDMDQWIDDGAEYLRLPQLRAFLQKKIIPRKMLDTTFGRYATNAVITAGTVKLVHLLMQKYISGNHSLFNTEGTNPSRMSPNFNTFIHLTSIAYLTWCVNNKLLTRPEEFAEGIDS